MRLLAFADLHLGAGANLGREPGDRLRDQAAVLERIFDLAAREGAEAILLAGDLFEGPTITPEQLEVFAMRAVGDVPVIAIPGNGRHDLAMREVNALAPLRHIDGVHIYSRPGVHDLGTVQIACLPWVSAARLVAQYDGDVPRDRVNQIAADLIVEAAARIADPRVKPTVLLMHGSLSGASLPQGISTDDLREPVVPVEELLDLGFAAVVAGHIHQPQIATLDDPAWTAAGDIDAPWLDIDCPLALYTGSPLPLNFGEAHVPHGCWLLDVKPPVTTTQFVPIESRPLVSFDWHPGAGDEPMPAFDEGAIIKVRITTTPGELRRLDLSAVRSNLIAAGAHTVKIEVDTVREERARVDSVTDEIDPLEAFDAWCEASGHADFAGAREQMQADLERVAA